MKHSGKNRATGMKFAKYCGEIFSGRATPVRFGRGRSAAARRTSRNAAGRRPRKYFKSPFSMASGHVISFGGPVRERFEAVRNALSTKYAQVRSSGSSLWTSACFLIRPAECRVRDVLCWLCISCWSPPGRWGLLDFMSAFSSSSSSSSTSSSSSSSSSSSFVSSFVVVLSALKRQPRQPSFLAVVLSALYREPPCPVLCGWFWLIALTNKLQYGYKIYKSGISSLYVSDVSYVGEEIWRIYICFYGWYYL